MKHRHRSVENRLIDKCSYSGALGWKRDSAIRRARRLRNDRATRPQETFYNGAMRRQLLRLALLLALAATAIVIGLFLISQGLERSDQWSSIAGLALNAVGLGLTCYSLIKSKHPRHGSAETETTAPEISSTEFPASTDAKGRPGHSADASIIGVNIQTGDVEGGFYFRQES